MEMCSHDVHNFCKKLFSGIIILISVGTKKKLTSISAHQSDNVVFLQEFISVSRVMRNPVLGFSNLRSDTNWAERPQKVVARLEILDLGIIEGLYYLCSKNKFGGDQLHH